MTTISLREAAKLRSKIENRLAELRNELYIGGGMVSVNLFDPDPLKELNEKPGEIRTAFARQQALAEVLRRIRITIDDANHGRERATGHSVSDLLAEIASLNAQIQALRPVLNPAPRLSDEQIQARIDGHLDLLESGNEATDVDVEVSVGRGRRPRRRRALAAHASSDSMTFAFMPQSMIDEFKATEKALANRVDKLHTAIERINNTTNVTVSDEDVAVLAGQEIEV